LSVRRAIARPLIVAPEGSAVRVWGEVLGALVMYGLLTVVFLLLPRLLLVVLGMSLDLRGRTAVALGGTVLGALVALGLLLAWLHRHGRSLADLGWRRPTTPPALLLGLVFGLA
jgi:hypothetical protein